MIDVMVIAHNEALNLPHCLSALQGWTRRVFVIDSGSTDGTPDIARSFGATVVQHAWEGYARQKNWGLRSLPFESDWVLIVDADEIITDELRSQLERIAAKPADQVRQNGFFINRLSFFMDRPIRHCGYYPSWNLRFFKRGRGVYEDREVHEHVVIDDPVGYIRSPMLHQDRRGLEHFIAKHNRYSTLEARAIFEETRRQKLGQPQEAKLSTQTRRHRWLKRHLTTVPMISTWRFLYMYVLRLGMLDGRAGLEFCKFISLYDYMVGMKLRELRRHARWQARGRATASVPPTAEAPALALVEGADPVVPAPLRRQEPTPQPVPAEQMRPESSPWSFREKLGRAVWMLLGRPVFRASFHNWYPFRAKLLRLFGAKVGKGVAIRPSVNVEVPWMLTIEDHATIGDHAILYSLGPIRIGKRAIISQYAHLCAGTHDYTDRTFRLIRAPIVVGDDVWIGADAFIGPNVCIGALTVVGARSSVYKDLPPRKVCVGNPAKPVGERQLR